MDWSPFSHIRVSGRRKQIPFFLLLLVGASIPLFYQAIAQEYLGGSFTTTIDFRNRIILDTPVELSSDPLLIRLAKTIRLAYDSTSSNTAGLLALASPSTKSVKIIPGLRREEAAEKFGNSLGWNTIEKNAFVYPPIHIEDATHPEGYYYPGVYAVLPGTSGEEVSKMMFERFEREVESRFENSKISLINVHTALKVASLIEREAAGKQDMRLISGIIWNRIFAGMNLQIDATLQYAKGTEKNGWWPVVTPKDKFIDSPYNTYQNAGFPPSPISSPSLASISAALNPLKTKCMFYLHDKNRRIHCAENYEDHEKNVRKYLK